MISVYDLKIRFQNLLRPICVGMSNIGITANQVTIFAMVLSIIYGGMLCLNIPVFWLGLPIFLLIRMGLNAIDGMLAREHNMKSKLGMALNELGDIISDIALFVPFIVYSPESSLIIFTFIGVSILTEFCGVLSFMINGERRYDGPMGKSDRAVAIGVLGLLIGLGLSMQGIVAWVFLVLTFLCLWACYNRLRIAIKG